MLNYQVGDKVQFTLEALRIVTNKNHVPTNKTTTVLFIPNSVEIVVDRPLSSSGSTQLTSWLLTKALTKTVSFKGLQ